MFYTRVAHALALGAAVMVIAGGMIPKIENALQAVEAGVGKVVITKATALLGNQGTVISND